MSNIGEEIEQYEARAKTFFVMSWTELVKKWSVLAALLATFLEGAQLWLHNNSGDLALLTQNKYYSLVVLIITFAIPVLRNVRQSGSVPAAEAKVTA